MRLTAAVLATLLAAAPLTAETIPVLALEGASATPVAIVLPGAEVERSRSRR